MKSQLRSKRKITGGKYKASRKKKLYELAGIPSLTQIGSKRIKIKRILGGSFKSTTLSVEEVIVNDGKKAIKLKILSVVNNPANINFTRRNIITKGAIVTTDKGDVKITTRPGQVGGVFGIFVK